MNPKSIFIVSLVFLVLGASAMIAEAQGPGSGGRRAPATSGTFTVNSNVDNTTADSSLTLREALYLARDGTDGVNGLWRGLTDGERAQTSGCSFTGSSAPWHISSGCGTAITDTIVFNLGTPTTITLGTSSLPTINDTAPTIIDGTSVSPTIDANSVSGTHNGLQLSSANNMVKKIAIANASSNGFYINNDHNTLTEVWVWNAVANGIYIGNQVDTLIDSVVIGVESRNAYNCLVGNKGNASDGIFVDGGTANVITNSVIACNGGNGITLDNGAFNTTIVGNYVGVTPYFGDLPNGGDGVRIQGDAHNNTIGGLDSTLGNNIQYNLLNGITISGTNTATNTLMSNYTSANGINGIRITQGAHNNVLTGLTGYTTSAFNSQDGILVAAGAHDNLIENYYANSNSRNGITLTGIGTSGNVISHTTIYNNTRDGINERNSADNNVWTNVSMHNNGGLGIDKDAPSDATNNIDPPFPIITSVSCSGTCTLYGTASPPGAGSTIVELYNVALDPSGYGEGFENRNFGLIISVDAGGHWSHSVGLTSERCFTAFQTRTTAGGVSTSSEFGPNTCRLFLPLIMK